MKDEIPTDEEVLAILAVAAPEGMSPRDVLTRLIEAGHNRAGSQRAMQRVLDRGKVEFNSALNLVAVRELVTG